MKPIKTIDNVSLGYFTLNGGRYKIVTYKTIFNDKPTDNCVTVCIVSPEGQGYFGGADANKTNAIEAAIDRALQIMQFAGVKCDIDSKTISKTLDRID